MMKKKKKEKRVNTRKYYISFLPVEKPFFFPFDFSFTMITTIPCSIVVACSHHSTDAAVRFSKKKKKNIVSAFQIAIHISES